MKSWNDLSIAKKLYLVIGTMGVLIACELLTLRFAMHTLSAVRAFVGGEGTWSKAQKDAAISLQRYAITRDEVDYGRFMEHLKIPEGDHRARMELAKPEFDMAIVRAGFIDGQIHPDDIEPMVDLLRRFNQVSYLAKAIDAWVRADQLLERFRQAGVRYHELVRAGGSDADLNAALTDIDRLNRELTAEEAVFSDVLGAGSRWMEGVVIRLLFFAVLAVEAVGLTLTFRTSRAISSGLKAANDAAARIGSGDFSQPVAITSRDEIGVLAESINRMGALLERSYKDLERRVELRTAELATMAQDNARLYEEASAAVQMRDEFFSIASHELKTPLTGLNLQLQLMSRQIRGLFAARGESSEDTGKVNELLNSCLRQGKRLAALSEELMDLTRIRLGKLEIHRERCDLVTLVRDAALGLGPDAARAGSSLDIRTRGPVNGRFDPTRMSQVATNLMSNAIKYGRGGLIEVVAEVAPGGSHASLSVSDRGMGISPEDLGRVFERFERAAEHQGKISGLGLGLYITRQIVESHGGTITVQSELGKGSVFRVEIPLDAAA